MRKQKFRAVEAGRDAGIAAVVHLPESIEQVAYAGTDLIHHHLVNIPKSSKFQLQAARYLVLSQ